MSGHEQFWSRVERRGPDDCWLWTGALNNKGYGRVGSGVLAHRVSFALAHGRQPEACVLHVCDTPRCVNPTHLFEGSQADNMRDCRAKGRFRLPPPQNKTHCAQGHPFAEHGRWRADRHHRICRICEKAHDRAKYVARQLAAGKVLRDPPEVMRSRSTRQSV